MNRITPEMVKKAYAKTGLKPKRGACGDHVTCGCALAAIWVAEVHPKKPDLGHADFWGWAESVYGFGYSHSFAHGFDWTSGPKRRGDYGVPEGFDDGLACAAAIFAEGTA